MLEQRNQVEIQNKLQVAMQKDDLDALIVFSPESVYYCTGFASNYTYLGRIPGTAIGIVPAEGKCRLVITDSEEQTAVAQCKDIDIETYKSFVFIDDIETDPTEDVAEMNFNDSWKIAIDLIRQITPNPKVGIELPFLPWDVGEKLATSFGRDNMVDGLPLIYDVRAHKTKWEIDCLRKAAQLSEAAMFETAKRIEVGMSEKDIMNIWHTSVFQLDKEIMDVYMAPAVGPHFAPTYIPMDYELTEGDIIRLDGGPSIFGYRSDIGRTFSVGKPSKRKEEIFNALLAGYKRGLEMIGPGVKLSAVFNEVQEVVKKTGIPNYKRGFLGHSVGLYIFQEEPPFISPTEESVFEPGMVICTETPYFSPINGGFIIEDTLLITENGYELFTNTNESLSWPE